MDPVVNNRPFYIFPANDGDRILIEGEVVFAGYGINEKRHAYNDVNHSERYFYRSDHINFASKDIPILFNSTGTHRDYHLVTDEEELIDYDKFLKMTRFGYKVGFNVAEFNDHTEVDNPMSSW